MFNPNLIDGFKINVNPVGQKYMRQTGPMIPAKWYITAEREEQLNMLGGALPKPVEGYMLLDTGAAHVAIDGEVARELRLKPLGKTTDVHGIAGTRPLEHYDVRLILPLVPMKANKPVLGFPTIAIPIEAWESPDIQANHHAWGYTTPDGKPLKVIGVLGRIFLQFATMTYDGLNGNLEIFVDKSVMYPKED